MKKQPTKEHQAIMNQIQANTYVISNYGIDDIQEMVTIHWNHLLELYDKTELKSFAKNHKDFLEPFPEVYDELGKLVKVYNVAIQKRFSELSLGK